MKKQGENIKETQSFQYLHGKEYEKRRKMKNIKKENKVLQEFEQGEGNNQEGNRERIRMKDKG